MATNAQTSGRNLVLRSVFMDPAVDESLRQEAFQRNVSKNDLIRKYLQIGMTTARNKGGEVDLTDLVPREKPKPTYAAQLLLKTSDRKAKTQKTAMTPRPAGAPKKVPAKKAAAR